jgi:hypothetical protein
MRRFIVLSPLLFVCIFFVQPVLAAQTTIYCTKYEGPRIDYDNASKNFVFKHMGQKEASNSFALAISEDGSSIKAEWQKENINTHEMEVVASGVLMRINGATEFIDFVGILSGYAVLVSYYPAERAIIYTEHGYNDTTKGMPKRTAKSKTFGMLCE